MEFTGERCVIGGADAALEKEHLDRYNFAKSFVKDMIVLDAACGSGYGTKILSETAKKVIGVDISQESIKYAKETFGDPAVSFHASDASDIRFLSDGSVDAVISFETIEHIPDHKKFLKEMKRVLKKGGLLIISTPNKKYSSPSSEKPVNPYHVIEFYEREFTSLLNDGFCNVTMYGQDVQTTLKDIKKMIVHMVPEKVRRMMIPEKLRGSYQYSILSGIEKGNAGKARYFIGVAVK